MMSALDVSSKSYEPRPCQPQNKYPGLARKHCADFKSVPCVLSATPTMYGGGVCVEVITVGWTSFRCDLWFSVWALLCACGWLK